MILQSTVKEIRNPGAQPRLDEVSIGFVRISLLLLFIPSVYNDLERIVQVFIAHCAMCWFARKDSKLSHRFKKNFLKAVLVRHSIPKARIIVPEVNVGRILAPALVFVKSRKKETSDCRVP